MQKLTGNTTVPLLQGNCHPVHLKIYSEDTRTISRPKHPLFLPKGWSKEKHNETKKENRQMKMNSQAFEGTMLSGPQHILH